MAVVPVGLLAIFLPAVWTCPPQKADFVMVSCFPNAIIANVPECPYGWEMNQLSLGGVCYSGINSPGYFRFAIPDLTPKNNSYCGTQSEYVGGKEPKYIFYNSIVSNDTSLTIRNQPVNYSFSCSYKASYLVNSAVFSQRVATVYINNGSVGSFRSQLSMNVFTNSKFLYAKDAPYTIDTSDIGSEVFIGIEAKGLSSSCSVDNTATIFENGKDSRSMFKFNSFRFQLMEKVSTVWLHCQVQICDSEKRTCQPTHPCTVRSQHTDPEGGVLSAEFQLKDSPILSLLGFFTLFVSLYTPLL
ncbi:Beta-tectorin [Acipenser ruthenus]|uniref:Beta-tectorin n=1 Tax=Acipenser ruthenus TaxID=7906 RepID=A0A662YM28_ACIRT|nr:Beta-tectorin [Acipenser ruthenus]